MNNGFVTINFITKANSITCLAYTFSSIAKAINDKYFIVNLKGRTCNRVFPTAGLDGKSISILATLCGSFCGTNIVEL